MTKVLVELKRTDMYGLNAYAFAPNEGEKIKSWDAINAAGSGLVEVEVAFVPVADGVTERTVREFFALDEVSRIREIRHERLG